MVDLGKTVHFLAVQAAMSKTATERKPTALTRKGGFKTPDSKSLFRYKSSPQTNQELWVGVTKPWGAFLLGGMGYLWGHVTGC